MLSLGDVTWNMYRWGLRLVAPQHPIALTSRAEEALARQQWGSAFDLSQAVLVQQADFAPALMLRALARLHLDDHSGALADLNSFLAHAEEPPAEIYYWRGLLYGQRNDWALASANFERAAALSPDEPQWLYWRAFALWKRGEWERLAEAVARLETLTPNSPLVWELRGHLHGHHGAWAEAEQAYSRALANAPDNLELRHSRAVARRRLGEMDGARHDIQELLAREPNNPWAHIEMSHFALASGELGDALRHARLAQAQPSHPIEAHLCEAATLLALEAWDEARALLEALRAAEPNAPLVEQLYGDLLAEEGEAEAAAASYRRVLAQEPHNLRVRVRLAGELVALQAWEAAAQELETALEADPRCEDAYATRADLHRYTNRPDAMRADLEQLLRLNPQHAWALASRAAHRQWEGDWPGAFQDYAAALALEPGQGWIWAFRGQLHLRAGNLDAARDDFGRAITLAPEDPWIRRQWADLLFRCGHTVRAAHILDALLQDEPHDGFARALRADLHSLAGEWAAAQEHWETLILSEHELAWQAHAALATLTDGRARAAHLARAEAERPEPSYWGATPALVMAQRALVCWLHGEPDAAMAHLDEALRHLEAGEPLWSALHPLLEQLKAAPLLARLDAVPLLAFPLADYARG